MEAPPQINDRYRLVEPLGEGGMGVVYRGHDTLLDRPVAVKILNPSGLGTEGRARLIHEAQAVARLDHNNIVTVFDAGESQGSPFIVMQLVEGQSLHKAMPLDLPASLGIVQQLCLALDHAHSQGVVHCDLKPENVLIAPDGTPKLMDFSLARHGASRITQEDALVGTVYYIAPEQALNKPVDGRTDLYALGVMLYELVAGRLPFQAESPVALVMQHIQAPPTSPRAYNPDIPPLLEKLIMRLLNKRPEDRPASALEVLALLQEIESMAGVQPEEVQAFSLLEHIDRRQIFGRAKELAQLRERWTESQQGHCQLVLVSGEPGIGKTRLCREILTYAGVFGALTLQGSCYEYETPLPYLPLTEALQGWVKAQTNDELQQMVGASAPELARILPEIDMRLGPLPPNPALPAEQERLRLFDHVADFLRRLSENKGLLLFFDDLHWADNGTLALLRYLLRRLRGERILILSAYREVELDRAHPLSAALAEWNRERLATRIPLQRLSKEDCNALLCAMFEQESISDEFTQAIYSETEGNPFFIEEVVKSLVEGGQIYRQNGNWERKAIEELAIPQSIREAIGHRLNVLKPESVEVLHTAALLGKNFLFSELLAGFSPEPFSSEIENQILDSLDEALQAQLIRSSGSEEFGFTHDKIREVLIEELNPIRRRRLHQRLGEGLETICRDKPKQSQVQTLAYHFLNSADLEKALHYSLLAAETANRIYAFKEAAGHYRHALECLEGLGRGEQIPEIYENIGDALYSYGLTAEPVKEFNFALEKSTSSYDRSRLKAKIGAAYAVSGDPLGLEYLEQAKTELDPKSQTEDMINTLVWIGRYHHYRGQLHQAINLYEQALNIAEPYSEEQERLFLIFSAMAGSYQHLGEMEKSIEFAQKCVKIGEQDDNPFAAAIGYEFLAEDYSGLGEWEQTLHNAQLDWDMGTKAGSLHRQAWAMLSMGFGYHGLGDLEQALKSTDNGLQLAEQTGDARLQALLLGVKAKIQIDLGDWDEARQTVDKAIELTSSLNQIALHSLAIEAHGLLNLAQGQFKTALDASQQVLEEVAETETVNMTIPLGNIVAEAYLELGEMDKAAITLRDFLPLYQNHAFRPAEAKAQKLLGLVYWKQRQLESALEEFAAAEGILTHLGSQLELGRLLHRRGLLHHELGNMEQVHQDLQRALELFKDCGAARDLQDAQGNLENL